MILLLALSTTFFSLILFILLALFNLRFQRAEPRIHSVLEMDQRRKSNADGQIYLPLLRKVQAPKFLETWISTHQLSRAGVQVDSGLFYSLWWILILIGSILFLMSIMISINNIFLFILACLAVLCSVFYPYLLVIQKIKNRKISIRKSFPIFLDLLTLSVEAGLGFFQALERVNRVQAGALKESISNMLAYHHLGFSREETLEKSVQDTQSDVIKRFAGAVNLSGKLGTPLSRTLRLQAHLLRTQRRQLAEVKAQTAPIRIIPALVFFFLPGLLLIYLAPPILQLLLR